MVVCGYTWLQRFIYCHTHFVNRTRNFVNSLLADVDDGGSAVDLVNNSRGHFSKIGADFFYMLLCIFSISSD